MEKDRVCSVDVHFHKLDVPHAELRAGLRTANMHLSPLTGQILTLQLRISARRARTRVVDDEGAPTLRCAVLAL